MINSGLQLLKASLGTVLPSAKETDKDISCAQYSFSTYLVFSIGTLPASVMNQKLILLIVNLKI